jgi:hypothetical protein
MARLRRRAILLPWRHRMSIDSSGKTAKPKLTITIESFHAHRSGTLYGFATVVIPELHLRIVDCPVHEKNGQRWAGLPAKPQVSKDGSMRRDERCWTSPTAPPATHSRRASSPPCWRAFPASSTRPPHEHNTLRPRS